MRQSGLSPSIDDAVQSRLRNLAQLTNSQSSRLRGDELRRALTNNSGSGTLSKRLKAATAWAEIGADPNTPAIRRAISQGRGPIRGGSGKPGDVNDINWRQQRWQALREQYNIPEQARMQSIDDIEPWEGDKNLRIWLGTNGASGWFSPEGIRTSFGEGPQVYAGKGAYAGETMRGGAAGTSYKAIGGLDLFEEIQKRGLPPKKILGGKMGEEVWQEFSRASMLEKGLSLPKRIPEEEGLPLMIDYVTKRNGEIMFVLHEGISKANTRFTWIELQHILSNPDALSKTTFIIDWYY